MYLTVRYPAPAALFTCKRAQLFRDTRLPQAFPSLSSNGSCTFLRSLHCCRHHAALDHCKRYKIMCESISSHPGAWQQNTLPENCTFIFLSVCTQCHCAVTPLATGEVTRLEFFGKYVCIDASIFQRLCVRMSKAEAQGVACCNQAVRAIVPFVFKKQRA